MFKRSRRKKNLPADQRTLVIFDVFKGHRVEDVETVLEENNVVSATVPSNSTDCLQPLDLSVNKAIKDHLRASFQAWYSQKVSEQLGEGKKPEDIKIDMRLSILKETQAKWMSLHVITSNLVQSLLSVDSKLQALSKPLSSQKLSLMTLEVKRMTPLPLPLISDSS